MLVLLLGDYSSAIHDASTGRWAPDYACKAAGLGRNQQLRRTASDISCTPQRQPPGATPDLGLRCCTHKCPVKSHSLVCVLDVCGPHALWVAAYVAEQAGLVCDTMLRLVGKASGRGHHPWVAGQQVEQVTSLVCVIPGDAGGGSGSVWWRDAVGATVWGGAKSELSRVATNRCLLPQKGL